MKRKLKTLWAANAAHPGPGGEQGTTCRNPARRRCGVPVAKKGRKAFRNGWVV